MYKRSWFLKILGSNIHRAWMVLGDFKEIFNKNKNGEGENLKVVKQNLVEISLII